MSKKQQYAMPSNEVDQELDAIRSIILDGYHEHLRLLEDKLDASRNEIARLNTELITLQQTIANEQQGIIPVTKDHIGEIIQYGADNQPDVLATSFGSVLGRAVEVQIGQDRDLMVDTVRPLLTDMIRQQIIVDKSDMSQALSPVMFSAVSESVQSAIRTLQQNIDHRMQNNFSSVHSAQKALRNWTQFRMSNISSGESALREVLPFKISELFFIQNGSGLLIAHYSASDLSSDSDLISAMLTAIRDFAEDALVDQKTRPSENQLSEIHYGSQKIIITSHSEAYCALVLDGIEPRKLKKGLKELVLDLHHKYELMFREYQGDPDTLPDLWPELDRFVTQTTNESVPMRELVELSDEQKARRKKFAQVSIRLAILLFFSLIILQIWVNYQVVTRVFNL